MARNKQHRSVARSSRLIVAIGVAAVVSVLATGCVEDFSEQLGVANYAKDINNSGSMIGSIDSTPTRVDRDGTRVRLETLSPWQLVQTEDIDDHGVVAGSAGILGEGGWVSFPVVWDRAGTATDLRPWLVGGDMRNFHAGVGGMSGNGLVAGTSQVPVDPTSPQPPYVRRVFLWDSRSRIAVDIPPEIAGDQPVVAAVNAHGVIVGSNAAGPARWTKRAGAYVHERLDGIAPHHINDNGDIVGLAGPAPGAPAILRAGATTPVLLSDAGHFISTSGMPGRINNNGTIVFTMAKRIGGPATTPFRWKDWQSAPTAFVWPGTTEALMYDLNDNGVAVGIVQTAERWNVPVRWVVTR